MLDGKRYDIAAGVYTINGCSANADQKNLIDFVRRMPYLPATVYLVHGDSQAKAALKVELQKLSTEMTIAIP